MIDKTSSSSNWSFNIPGIALAVVLTSTMTSQKSLSLVPSRMGNSINATSSASRSTHLMGEITSWEERRVTHIKALRGKYKNILSNSEEFAKKKIDEILLEG